MYQILPTILSIKKNFKKNAPLYKNETQEEVKLNSNLCIHLTMTKDNENSFQKLNLVKNKFIELDSKHKLNFKQYSKKFLLFCSKQTSQNLFENENFLGEICDIKQSPYQIFKAAESGNLKEFQRLYEVDNSRLSYQNTKGRTCVHFAAAANRVNILNFIFQHDGDLNLQDYQGNTPMHDAIQGNACIALDFLLEKEANTSILNHDLYAPLHLVAILNNVDCLRVMIRHKNKFDTFIKGKHGRTPLHIACIYNNFEITKILFTEFNCCPKQKCHNGYTSMHEAARNASVDSLNAILDLAKNCGYNKEDLMSCCDAEDNVPLHLAVYAGDVKTVDICLKSGSKINSQQHDLFTPLHLACSQGALEIVKFILEYQPNQINHLLSITDAQQMTPIHCAAMFDHVDIVSYLCSLNSNINLQDKSGRNVLLLACARKAWKSAQVLIQNGCELENRDSLNQNLLHHIVMSDGDIKHFSNEIRKINKFEIFKSLLNDRDLFGCTPLHFASKDGNLKTIECLLDLGACLNVKNKDYHSVLHFAARYGRYNTVKFLLNSSKGNFIINEMDGEGMTPLHIASQYGHTQIVQLLLLKGALLHRDHRGRTPLHYAALNGHTSTMQQLLTVHSHLLDQTDREGNTALHLASIKNKPKVASILLSLNCKIIKNSSNCTPIDYALNSENSKVMQTLVLHPTRNLEVINYPIKKYDSLIEGLIANMPEVMTAVLDNGISTSTGQSEDSKSFYIKYNFDCLRKVGDSPLPVLNMMVRYGREELISHPLCLKYLQTKWNSYGMYYHSIYLFIYMAYLFCLTKIVLQIVDSPYHNSFFYNFNYEYADEKFNTLNQVSINLTYNKEDEIYNNKSTSYNQNHSLTLSTYLSCFFVLSYAFINILKELYQICQQKIMYFIDIINLMLWILYFSSSLMIIGHLFPNHINSSLLYIISAIATFLAWFNCLLYFQKFNSSGIYVIMFFEILLTLVRVLLVFCVLIIAFSLSFYILLNKCQRRKGFNNVPIAIVRIITMMLGEIDFLSTFLQPLLDDKKIDIVSQQMEAATWFLIMFAILMPILLMNLLIGLAVGDIETVRCNAHMKRLTMQVKMHTDIERKLPKKFNLYIDKAQAFEYPNNCGCGNYVWKAIRKFFVNNKQLNMFNNSQSKNNCNFNLNSNSNIDILNELHKQKNKLCNLSKILDQQFHLIELIAKKIEIQTENDYKDYSSEISDDEDTLRTDITKMAVFSNKNNRFNFI